MMELELNVTLRFESPVSVGAAGAGASMANKAAQRDGFGRLIIPASQLKGRLRHSCEVIVATQCGGNLPNKCRPPRADQMCHISRVNSVDELCPVCRIFGCPGHRGSLRFDNLVEEAYVAQPSTSEIDVEPTVRTMVAINRSRRTVEPQRLYFVETAPNLPGYRFLGSPAITGTVPDGAYLHLLLAGFKLLGNWGGGCSRGLGWAEALVEHGGEDQSSELQFDRAKLELLFTGGQKP